MSYKDNPKPPQITFRRIRGRIVPIVRGKPSPTGGKLIQEHIQGMASEVKAAQKGERGVGFDEASGTHKNWGSKSTYPKFYSELGFKNKSNFFRVLEKMQGKKYDQIVKRANDELSNGAETSFGRIPPNQAYRVATRQAFNNTNVVFRNIDGIVRPMRISEKNRVPF